MRKRFLALFLCLCLCLTLLPAAAAEDIEIVDVPPAGDDALDVPVDDVDVPPAGDDALDVPLDDEIALIDEPDRTEPGPDAEIQVALLDSGSCGEKLNWELRVDGRLYIRGSGAMTDFERRGAPWYQYRNEIKELYIYDGTTIGAYAFADCPNLTIPADIGHSFSTSVTSIGKSAFLCCYALDYITITKNVTSISMQAFDYCTGLKRMTICGAPTLDYRSLGCENLEELSFVGDAPSFDDFTFRDTTAKVWYPPDNSTWTADVRQNYSGTLTWTAGYHGWIGDDITWDLNASSGALTLSGSGGNWDFGSSGDPSWYTIRGKIKSASVGSGITCLSDYAMMYLENMSSITLPDTLTEIGFAAFFRSGLTSISIPKSVTEIHSWAFYYCSDLTEIYFTGHAPTDIYGASFIGVTATAHYFPVYTWTEDKLQQYGGTLTWSCDDKIGDDVTWDLYENGRLTINGSGATLDYPSDYPAFYGFRDEITEVNVYGTGIQLGSYLFYGLDKLEAARIRNVTAIGKSCFSYCDKLKLIRFSDFAPSFGNNAFYRVTATAYYPPITDGGWTDDVMQNYGGTITWVCDNKIGDDVYWTLDTAGNLNITGTGPTWDYTESWEITGRAGFYYSQEQIKKAVVGEGVTRLGDYLLKSLLPLQSLQLPSTLTEIGSYAVCDCRSLKAISIPKSVTSIERSAFDNCQSAQSLYFYGAPTLGYDAFDSCFSLKEIRFFGHAPTSINSTAFDRVTTTAYYYPVYSWTEDKMQDYGAGTITWVCDDKIGDDVTWDLYENGRLTINGSGATWDWPSDYPAFYGFRDEVTSAQIDAGITYAGNFLFYNMEQLKKVVISGQTDLGTYCFNYCFALKEIRFLGEAPSFAGNCFYNVTASAYYPANDPSWTADIMQDYGGDITWIPFTGYAVAVANYTKAVASCSLSPGASYQGETSFTVSSGGDQAVLVAIKNGDDYTRLPCETSGGIHSFTIDVDREGIEIAIVLKGDANLDGKVESRDGNMVSRASVGKYAITNALARLAADVDGNGKIESRDGNMISRASVNKFKISW